MAFPCTDSRPASGASLPVQVDGCARRAWHRTARATTGVGGGHIFSDRMNMTCPEFEDTRVLAQWVGLQLICQNDSRNGRYRLLSGPRIVAHSNDLRELQQFALAWRYVR
ncbi:MAG: hypothetical protein QM777_16910 [Pseudorhodoferax sp.]